MSTIRKRFIAGAICPGCNAMDTLAVWREEQGEVMECVKCGHHQRQSEQPAEAHRRSSEQVIAIFPPE